MVIENFKNIEWQLNIYDVKSTKLQWRMKEVKRPQMFLVRRTQRKNDNNALIQLFELLRCACCLRKNEGATNAVSTRAAMCSVLTWVTGEISSDKLSQVRWTSFAVIIILWFYVPCTRKQDIPQTYHRHFFLPTVDHDVRLRFVLTL